MVYDWREQDPEWGDDPNPRHAFYLFLGLACLAIVMIILWQVA